MKDRSNFRLVPGRRSALLAAVPKGRCFIRLKMILTLANKAYVLPPPVTSVMDDPSPPLARSPARAQRDRGSGKQYATDRRDAS